MSKKQLKKRTRTAQQNECALTKKPLPEDTKLYDTDRIIPKASNGTYSKENTRVVDPVAHLKRHGNYKKRAEILETLKIYVEARRQSMKAAQKVENRLGAHARKVDNLHPDTIEMLENMLSIPVDYYKGCEKKITKLIKQLAKEDPFVKTLADLKGMGPITAANLLIYIDLTEADYASSVWAFAGYHTASHKRYTKGVSGGGHKWLRTVMYNWAEVQIKHRTIYRNVYDAEKQKLSISRKTTESRQTNGKLVECMWKDTMPNHRHMAAMRKMIKHFLADYWKVGRLYLGLPTPDLWIQEKAGHTGIVQPEERGWVLPKNGNTI